MTTTQDQASGAFSELRGSAKEAATAMQSLQEAFGSEEIQ